MMDGGSRCLRVDDEMGLVPGADARRGSIIADERDDGEPGDAALAVGQHDKRGEQWSGGRAGVAADLKQRLREAVTSAGRQARHARRLGVKDR